MESRAQVWIEGARRWLETQPLAAEALSLLAIAVLAFLVHLLFRRVIIRAVDGVVRRTSVSWDNALQEAGVFERLTQIAPFLVFWYGIQAIPDLNETLETLLRRVAISGIVMLIARAVAACLQAANVIYAADPSVGRRSIKGYLQLVELVVYAIAVVLVIATLMDRSPLLFLSGIGAMTAVLLLIFRDTLLGLVASVQISKNDMLRVGDWIEMPAFGADGDVIDIALHTVKVQNWDKTITSIPTSKMIEASFKNWRGMTRAGGRRIKRSLFFDVNTVRFLTDDEVETFGRYALLRPYIEKKRRELAEYNAEGERDPSINADIRRLTNLGTLRAYIHSYLRHHPRVHDGMTLLVRQLQAGSQGVPIEIYCFTNTTEWGAYEEIQADIFDHILAIVPEFGLRVFQDESDFVVEP